MFPLFGTDSRSKSSDDDGTQREFLFDGAEGVDASQSVMYHNNQFLRVLGGLVVSDSREAGDFRPLLSTSGIFIGFFGHLSTIDSAHVTFASNRET